MLGFRTRLNPVGIVVQDNFNRTSGSGLGTTSDGSATWQVITGTWSINNNTAYTSTPASSNPLAIVEVPYADIDLSSNVSPTGNDALYFRVVDASNWLRLKLREYTTSSSNTQYCTHGYYENDSVNCFCGGFVGDIRNQSGTNCASCPDASSICAAACSPNSSSVTSSGSCYQNGYCTQACGTTTTYYYNYYLDLEKMTGGTLASIGSVSLGQSVTVTSLGVIAQGNSIQTYANGALQYTYTDTTNQTATRHGIGRGSSNSTTQDGQMLDNFLLKPLN